MQLEPTGIWGNYKEIIIQLHYLAGISLIDFG